MRHSTRNHTATARGFSNSRLEKPLLQICGRHSNPIWHERFSLLVFVQTSRVRHNISIQLSCCLARKNCDRLRSGQSPAHLVSHRLGRTGSETTQRRERLVCVSVVENEPSETTLVVSFQQQGHKESSHFEATVFDRV